MSLKGTIVVRSFVVEVLIAEITKKNILKTKPSDLCFHMGVIKVYQRFTAPYIV